MSQDSPSKSHAVLWIISVLAVLLLYAASWPPIELKVCGRDPEFSSGPTPPAWVMTMYRPMHMLKNTRMGYDALDAYYYWWETVILHVE
jgi:hypothetical protein